MTNDQIQEAIAQAIAQCRILEATYEPVSLRGCLQSLGYETEQTDEVIRYAAAQGFTYCADPIIRQPGPGDDGRPEYPSADACHWGPDQLRSRLECL